MENEFSSTTQTFPRALRKLFHSRLKNYLIPSWKERKLNNTHIHIIALIAFKSLKIIAKQLWLESEPRWKCNNVKIINRIMVKFTYLAFHSALSFASAVSFSSTAACSLSHVDSSAYETLLHLRYNVEDNSTSLHSAVKLCVSKSSFDSKFLMSCQDPQNRQSFNSTTPKDNEPIKLLKPRGLANLPRKKIGYFDGALYRLNEIQHGCVLFAQLQ